MAQIETCATARGKFALTLTQAFQEFTPVRAADFGLVLMGALIAAG
jgi:hypothetical protein